MPKKSDVNIENLVQKSTNYKQFKFISTNRDAYRGHVESLKKAFEEIGNLTQAQPILVNEEYEIIDGQHRFLAASELGEPIYFMVRPGLTVHDARVMNILHRNWTTDDFAHSYADAGDTSYIKYLELRGDYGMNHSVTLMYILGEEEKGAFAAFRQGEFTLDDEAGARSRLEKLLEVWPLVSINKDKYFALAFLKTIAVEGYDQRRMVRKISQVGDQYIRKFGAIPEFQRALEEVYNHQISEANRLRLY